MRYSTRYYAGAAGHRYFYASQATERCPFGEQPPGWLQDVLGSSDDRQVQTIDAALLFRKAHAAIRHAPFENGRCRACGAELEKVGYATWIEEPWPTEDELRAEVAAARAAGEIDDEHAERRLAGLLSSRAIDSRVGSGFRQRPGSHRYWPLKREAIEWAREEADLDLAIAREEA